MPIFNIEIRLRKTTPHDTSVKAPDVPAGAPMPLQVPAKTPCAESRRGSRCGYPACFTRCTRPTIRTKIP